MPRVPVHKAVPDVGDDTPRVLPAATESEGSSYMCVCDSHRKLLPDKGAGEGVGDTLAPSCPVLITSPDAAKTLVLAAS